MPTSEADTSGDLMPKPNLGLIDRERDNRNLSTSLLSIRAPAEEVPIEERVHTVLVIVRPRTKRH